MLQQFILIAAGILLLSACNNEKCDPSKNSLSEGGSLNFQLVDARTSQNLLAQTPGNASPYFRDSVMVYNERKEPQFTRPIDISGEIYFSTYGSTTELNATPFNTTILRRFILYLNYRDQDTIDIAFKLHKNECGFSEFDNINIKYNTLLVYEGNKVTQIPTRVFRKK